MQLSQKTWEVLTCCVKPMAVDGAHAFTRLWVPHPEARIALAAARHHQLAVWGEASARDWAVMPGENLPEKQRGLSNHSLTSPTFDLAGGAHLHACLIGRVPLTCGEHPQSQQPRP